MHLFGCWSPVAPGRPFRESKYQFLRSVPLTVYVIQVLAAGTTTNTTTVVMVHIGHRRHIVRRRWRRWHGQGLLLFLELLLLGLLLVVTVLAAHLHVCRCRWRC